MVASFADKPYALRQFRRIASYARRSNPFYRTWITDPESPPLLDRATALEHNDEILNGNEPTGTTSGSIGVPLRYAHSREWNAMAAKDVARFVGSLGGPLPTVRILHASSIRPRRTASMNLEVTAGIDEQLEFILRHIGESGAAAITTLPTNAELLASAVLERGIDMSSIRRFGTLAETLEPHQRALVAAAFPAARLWSTYSSMEFGMIAAMCPYEPDFFHLMAHRLGVEVLRDDGTPAPAGEAGAVYVTDYFNRLSPLIRYELGDLAIRGECPCGKIELPALARVLGRVSGTIVNRNGERVLFSNVSIALREIPGMRQYQVIQNSIEGFEAKVSCDHSIDAEIHDAFLHSLGYVPRELVIRYVDSIPRDPSGKYRTSICRIQ